MGLCGPRTTRCMWRRRRDATASSDSTATNSTRTLPRMNDPSQTSPPPQPRTKGSHAPADGAANHPEGVAQLGARLDELQRERDHLIAVVDILQEISASLHFVDILQTIARKMGDAFALDRCAIFLTGERDEVRLVASYEDPSIRNLVVDLTRYPEPTRTFATGAAVGISADAAGAAPTR